MDDDTLAASVDPDSTKQTWRERKDKHYAPLTTAIALSLYSYNVAAILRAERLYVHFKGACMEVEELVDILLHCKGTEATELPFPTAEIYIEHALERYGAEAEMRVLQNRSLELSE